MLLCSGCGSMYFYPTKVQYFHPRKAGLHVDDEWLTGERGAKIHGWYFHNTVSEKPKALIVFFHGNGENMTSHFMSLLWILQHDYDFFIFDYEGYGESSGSPTFENAAFDGDVVLRWASQWAGDVPLVVYAQSLGGAVAMRSVLDVKNDVKLSLVVVDSTFVSYKEAGQHALKKSWITWLLQPLAYVLVSDKYAPGAAVKNISPIPLVVIHGDHDQIIDYELGQEVYNLAAEPKEFWTVPGGRHTDSFWRHGDLIKNKFLAALEKYAKTIVK